MHPFGQRRDLLGRQLRLRRHLEIDVVVANAFDQQARVGIARHDRRPLVAAAEHGRDARHSQARLLLVVAVTLVAVGGQDRPDSLLVELDRRVVRFSRLRRRFVGRGVGPRPARRAIVVRPTAEEQAGRGRESGSLMFCRLTPSSCRTNVTFSRPSATVPLRSAGRAAVGSPADCEFAAVDFVDGKDFVRVDVAADRDVEQLRRLLVVERVAADHFLRRRRR